MIVDVCEGMTKTLRFQLLADDVAPDLTGTTLELVMFGNDGVQTPTTGDTAWDDAATAKASYAPDASDFAVALSPYTWRWKVTAGAEIDYYPRDLPNTFVVRKP